jgi:hypothetical protein
LLTPSALQAGCQAGRIGFYGFYACGSDAPAEFARQEAVRSQLSTGLIYFVTPRESGG